MCACPPTMSSGVADSIRSRIGPQPTRMLSDAEVLKIGLAASCGIPREVVQFVVDRQLAKEINALNTRNVALTSDEFKTLVFNLQPLQHDQIASLIKGEIMTEFITRFERQMVCTISEQAQHDAWRLPHVKVLTYVALHSEDATEERVECCLGGMVRSDIRRLEDLRSMYDGDSADIYTLGSSIEALVGAMRV